MKSPVAIINRSHAKTVMSVAWELSNYCNFDCSYCPPTVHDKTSRFHAWEVILMGLDKLAQIATTTHRTVQVTLLGGEPLLNPWVNKMAREMSQPGRPFSRFEVVTNFSIPKGRLEAIFSEADTDKIRVSVVPSFHREFMDPDVYIEKVNWFSQRFPKIRVSPVVMLYADPEGWEISQRIFKNLNEGTYPDLRPIRENFGTTLIKYSPEQLNEINEYYNKKKSKRFVSCQAVYADGSVEDISSPTMFQFGGVNNWKGWTCSAGVSSLFIKSDLTVCAGICGKNFAPHQIGKIDDPNLLLPAEWRVCHKRACMCSADIRLDKRAPELPLVLETGPFPC